MILRRVVGASMAPTLGEGSLVIARKRLPRLGEIAIARIKNMEIIKRVVRIEGNSFYLVGDNSLESTDSRHFGKIAKTDIIGTIMIVLPSPVNPPKPEMEYGPWLGRFAALILITLALVQLYRIDTFVPILDVILPGGHIVVSIVGVFIIMTEIFAVPFALRMKLSPLAHIVSGALLAHAPLWWLLITMWSTELHASTGQLGEFVALPGSAALISVNSAWLIYSYFTLYSLGYNKLSMRRVLRK